MTLEDGTDRLFILIQFFPRLSCFFARLEWDIQGSCLTLENKPDRSSRNVGNYQLTLKQSLDRNNFQIRIILPFNLPLYKTEYCMQLIHKPHKNLVLKINPLKTKRRQLYLKTQFVPRSKHFSSRL